MQKPFGLWLRLRARLDLFFFTQDAFKILVALWLLTHQASENTGCGSAGDVSNCDGRCCQSWGAEGILQVWLQSVLTHLLTGLAVEAAESLVGVLLVLQTRPELSEGQIFAPVARPLGRRRLGSVARQQEE